MRGCAVAGDPVIAIVTGSRDWTDRGAIERAISALPRGSVVFHGAARGADSIADAVAAEQGRCVQRFPADWTQGFIAGPIRNRRMRDEAKAYAAKTGMPVVCLAFPLPRSRGTLDMIALCVVEGWEVRRG